MARKLSVRTSYAILAIGIIILAIALMTFDLGEQAYYLGMMLGAIMPVMILMVFSPHLHTYLGQTPTINPTIYLRQRRAAFLSVYLVIFLAVTIYSYFDLKFIAYLVGMLVGLFIGAAVTALIMRSAHKQSSLEVC
jgi:hypothetical protein